jgi:hypothetical protein
MSDTKTKDELEDAKEQPESSINPAHARLWERARQQGVKPIKSIKDLRGDLWPEDESVDEFLDWVRAIRRSDNPRRLPE